LNFFILDDFWHILSPELPNTIILKNQDHCLRLSVQLLVVFPLFYETYHVITSFCNYANYLFIFERWIFLFIACCWSHNRFSFCENYRYQPFYFFLLVCLSHVVCCTYPVELYTPPCIYTRVLICFFYCVFFLLNFQGPLEFSQNYLVLVIVSRHDFIFDKMAQGGSFVHTHNWKKMTFSLALL
jgi:hypothetical protein